MKALLASILAATLLWGCGGGGGDAGTCSGSPEYCAEFAEGSGSGAGSGTGGVSAGFRRSGIGNAVFDLPPDVTGLRIQATYDGPTHTFFVDIGGSGLVATTIGSLHTPPGFDGTFTGPGGARVEVWGSDGVEWVMTEFAP